MDPIRTGALARSQIAEFISSPRGVRAFEDAQADIGTVYDTLAGSSFLVVDAEPLLGAERILAPVVDELVGSDGGANQPYTLGLADTAVVPGSYGDPAGFVHVAVDQKGRVTGLSTFTISGASGVDYDDTTGIFTAHPAGTYGAPTGIKSRASFASYVAGATLTYGAAYVQAEHTATGTRLALVEGALATISQTLAALVTDMKANGNLA